MNWHLGNHGQNRYRHGDECVRNHPILLHPKTPLSVLMTDLPLI